MALKEINGSTHHKIMVASGSITTDREEHPAVNLGITLTLIGAFIMVMLAVLITSPLWLPLS